MIDMPKLMKNTWKNMIKIKNHHNLSVGTSIVYRDGQCHKSYL